MAFVVDDDAVVNVVLGGGFGIGKGGVTGQCGQKRRAYEEDLRRTPPLCRCPKREVDHEGW